jgi:hypothetical protein
MRTFEIKIGELTFTLKSMSARQFIAVQRGEVDEAGLIEMLAAAAVKHPFGDGADAFLDGCDVETSLALLRSWAAQQTEIANPKGNASNSPEL